MYINYLWLCYLLTRWSEGSFCWALGIRDHGLMNISLLLKLLDMLFVAEDSAWATWVPSLSGDLCGPHWEVIRTLFPLYQVVTRVFSFAYYNRTLHDQRARRSLFFYLADAEDNAKSMPSLLNRGGAAGHLEHYLGTQQGTDAKELHEDKKARRNMCSDSSLGYEKMVLAKTRMKMGW